MPDSDLRAIISTYLAGLGSIEASALNGSQFAEVDSDFGTCSPEQSVVPSGAPSPMDSFEPGSPVTVFALPREEAVVYLSNVISETNASRAQLLKQQELEAFEKRRRNSAASARFRGRKKEEERLVRGQLQELRQAVGLLRIQMQELKNQIKLMESMRGVRSLL